MRTYVKKLLKPKKNKSGKKAFFLHLPKCGGTSLNRRLRSLFDAPVHMDAIASKIAADALGMPLAKYREQLLMYYMAQYRFDCLAGHFDWSDIAYSTFGGDWTYLTILREPVDKWFSQYYFNRYKKGDHFKTELEIEDFLASDAGVDLGRDYLRKLSETATIENAKENLTRFAIVGILDELDRFEADFKRVFGVRLNLPLSNKNPAGPEKKDAMIDPKIRDAVEEICQPNVEVYEYARVQLGGRTLTR